MALLSIVESSQKLLEKKKKKSEKINRHDCQIFKWYKLWDSIKF